MIFTWWNKLTFGTFLKTLFSGIYVGKDEFGNKYYKNKKDERWVIYSNNIEATRISSDWYLWMHHTINNIPNDSKLKKYKWQKQHSENMTGTNKSFKPVKIRKDATKKNTILGTKYNLFLIFFLIFSFKISANEKIVTTPLINLDQIKPS